MFSESGNTTGLLRRLLGVWICEKSKMAHINLRLTDAMFNSQLHTRAEQGLGIRTGIGVEINGLSDRARRSSAV